MDSMYMIIVGIMMTLAIDAFRGIRRTNTTEIEWEE